jgi:ubiquitin carboxyl-terminal hydrolase 4/11
MLRNCLTPPTLQCFMNSTLQCLAHTGPLRKYFLSGAYRSDLNTKNPLGTAGDLAEHFAQLLAEMWVSTDEYSVRNNVVYPRSFKFALGRHADQFVGYDQHDSQELASYLLDALHEDTNRVTVKPYVEKPEQEEGESDEHASAKALSLHEKREDSYIHRLFVGQVKSRIQCCQEGCGRVSTTFDPFLFLSLPIPGSSERNLRVRFVPLDPALRIQELTIRIEKVASVRELVSKALQQLDSLGIVSNVDIDDILPADIWQKEVYEVLELPSSVERIRDNDETYLFQLTPKRIIESDAGLKERESEFASDLGMRDRSTPMRYRLDEATKARIDHGDVWITELSKYLRSPSGFSTAFNPSRGSAEERVKIFNRLCTFIDQCYQECESDVFDESVPAADSTVVTADEEVVQGMRERCESSSYFDRVERRFDLAVLEFVAFKMREEIVHMERVRVSMAKRSIIVYIRMRKSGYGPRVLNSFATSFPLRIASDTTVYKLRLDLATRLTRYLKNPATPLKRPSSGEPSSERTAPSANAYESSDFAPGSVFGTPEQLLIRQIPLSYECRSDTIQSARAAPRFSIQLGCLDKGTHLGSAERPIVLASPKNDKEAELVADTVGDGGTVYLEWPTELAERHFDESEFESVDSHPMGGTAGGSDPEASLSIYDCIDKYCQREQLEESDMWYCNKCKELVCAWKQFQLYRCPPILIVHLKRFQYSATTHRRDKIATFVDFPLCGLDLSGRVAHWEEGEKPVYDCYAVSHHFGGLGGGHYTAHALNDDNVWCYYDDSRVTTPVDTSEVVSEAAYVLYYRRQDVSAEDFAVCLTTSEPSSPAASIGSQDGLFRDATAAVVDEDEDGMDVDVVVRQPRDVEVASTGTSSLGSRDDFQSIDEPLRVGGKKRGNSLGGSDDIFPLQ